MCGTDEWFEQLSRYSTPLERDLASRFVAPPPPAFAQPLVRVFLLQGQLQVKQGTVLGGGVVPDRHLTGRGVDGSWLCVDVCDDGQRRCGT